MLHISDVPSFSRLKSIPSHTHTHTHKHIYRYHSLSIHSLIDRYLGCFYIFAIANSATVNTGMPVFLKRSWFQFFPIHIQKWDCWIIRWLYFDILRKLYIVFHSSNCTILHPFKQCAKVSKVSISPYSHEHFFFFNNSHPNRMKWNLTVVLSVFEFPHIYVNFFKIQLRDKLSRNGSWKLSFSI